MSSVEAGKGATPIYKIPVDSELKATRIEMFSFAQPHMRAFHLSWFIFFITFIATFAPAALLPVIRDDMSLTKTQLGLAGVTAVCGAIFMRMCMGAVLDTIGPRFGNALTVLLFAPAVFCMALVETGGDFQCVRLFIGCSLCAFVTCQYWVGSMFNVKIVGTANAITAGWGNMGGGFTALIMPLIYEGIVKQNGVPDFQAWRWSFFVPGALYVVIGIVAMVTAQDHPAGDFRTLKSTGYLATGKGSFISVLKCALFNYRTWVLCLCYGYSFGVELTVDNMIVEYLYDHFEMSLTTAGCLGALFGLMNIFSRASGGIISDIVAVPWGMRGRLWALWIIQTLGGVFCIAMAYVDYDQGATIGVMIIFSIFCQQACGATFGVAPFVSRRAYGVVSGTVGAGGNVGAVVTQTIFFAGSQYSPVMTKQEGLKWMGVMIIAVTTLLCTIHFPMWGSMFFPGNEDYSEEDYYLKEWSAEEVAQGLHTPSMKFAMESRSQRGSRRGLKADSKSGLKASSGAVTEGDAAAAR